MAQLLIDSRLILLYIETRYSVFCKEIEMYKSSSISDLLSRK